MDATYQYSHTQVNRDIDIFRIKMISKSWKLLSSNKLLTLLLFCWIVPSSAKSAFPELFGSAFYQYPPFLIICLLGPYYCFYALKKKRFLEACLPIAIIMHSLIMLASMMFMALNFSKFLDESYHTKDILDLTKNGWDEDKRKMAASLVYREVGEEVAYKKDSGELVLYSPTNKDVNYFSKTVEVAKKRDDLNVWLERQAKESLWLMVIQLISFAVVSIIFILFEYRKLHQQRLQKNASSFN